MRRICSAVKAAADHVAHAMFAEHAVPALAVIGRFDQRIRQIPELPFVIGGLKIRRYRSRCCRTDPIVNVIADEAWPDAPKVAIGAGSGQEKCA